MSPLSNSKLDGIEKIRLGKAINKLRISEGISLDQLASDAACTLSQLHTLFSEGYCSEKALISIMCALDNATKLTIKNPTDLVQKADTIPEITRTSVANAIQKLFTSKGMSFDALERMRKEKFGDGMPGTRRPDFEAEYHRAKTMGYNSIGDLLVKVAALPPEIDDTKLCAAVKALRQARGVPYKTLASKLDITVGSCQAYIKKGRFSVAIKDRLPQAFALDSLQAILDEAAALEPLPDRKIYGEAVEKHMVSLGMTPEQLGTIISCSVDIVNDILCANRMSGEVFLRRIPKALLGEGQTMANLIKSAKDLPALVPKKMVNFVIRHTDRGAHDDGSTPLAHDDLMNALKRGALGSQTDFLRISRPIQHLGQPKAILSTSESLSRQ